MNGIEALTLDGGMRSWSLAWNTAQTTISDCQVVQVRRTGKGCLSYTVESQSEAIVIDPSVDPEVYVRLLSERGWRLVAVADSHIHADHLSRSRQLAHLEGAALLLPTQNRAQYPFRPVADGDRIVFGSTALVAMRTPGHTACSTTPPRSLATHCFSTASAGPTSTEVPARSGRRARVSFICRSAVSSSCPRRLRCFPAMSRRQYRSMAGCWGRRSGQSGIPWRSRGSRKRHSCRPFWRGSPQIRPTTHASSSSTSEVNFQAIPASWRREPTAAPSLEAGRRMKASRAIRLGLRANWQQFALLVAINAFVGGVVGVERSTLAPLAESDFHLASSAAILSFLISFGLVKAASNFIAGGLADRFGRRTVLLVGWMAALPVPLLIIPAPSWGWVVFANVLLGLNQGLAWSTTVNMKIDLVGPRRRGFALGLNEASGYLAVSAAAAVAGFLAANYGIRPGPYLLAEGFAACGLLLSLFARDTSPQVELESVGAMGTESLGKLAAEVSFRDRTMSSACQAGLINNLNDGMAWALLPLFFAAHGLGLREIGLLASIYPAIWGAGQLGTGWISDYVGRKSLVVAGMLLQSLALAGFVIMPGFTWWVADSVLLGAGTALVYPTLLAVVSDAARVPDRATAIGIYRFWRDSGYPAGAIIAGVIADAAGFPAAIITVAGLTGLSGLVVAVRMRETLPRAAPLL